LQQQQLGGRVLLLLFVRLVLCLCLVGAAAAAAAAEAAGDNEAGAYREDWLTMVVEVPPLPFQCY
jgi:hypothetical protein